MTISMKTSTKLKIINENHAESLEIAARIFDKENDKDIFKIVDYIYQRKM